MKRSGNSRSIETKVGMHPRNRHKDGYDFEALVAAAPGLAAFVRRNPSGDQTIDFADPAAVRALNRALLKHHYGIGAWNIPEGYLCPPVPGRADYVHHLADLLGAKPLKEAEPLRILEIGIGANCVYPIVARHDYGWTCVGTDIDAKALRSAERIISSNTSLAGAVECRLQTDPQKIFHGVTRPGERFAASLCNPPFHATVEEAAAGTVLKMRHLARRTLPRQTAPLLNFGGKGHELAYPGGEIGFIRRMIAESAECPALCGWFTCLVAKSEHLPDVEEALRRVRASEVRVVPMAQGQKRTRFVAWRFDEKAALRAGGRAAAG